MALSLVPPPDSLVNQIAREGADFDSPALLAPSARRRIRKRYQRCIKRQLCNNPYMLPLRKWLLSHRQNLEKQGATSDPSRIRKLCETEDETNAYFQQLLQEEQLPEELKRVVKGKPDAINLLWEFATRGGGGNKPKLRRTSGIWKTLGLDPRQLGNMSLVVGLIASLNRVTAILGLSGQPLESSRLLALAKWVIRTHLPPETELTTTPEALNKATKAGLIHNLKKARDSETGKSTEQEIEDSGATRFVRETEDRDEVDRIISRAKLSAGERLVLQGISQELQGENLVDWLKKQGADIAPGSIPVLASRAISKLRAAAKT